MGRKKDGRKDVENQGAEGREGVCLFSGSITTYVLQSGVAEQESVEKGTEEVLVVE